MVETPVLFITFARPDYARRTWDAIKAAQPKNLYFYSNKGREEKEGEIERNEEIRAFVKEIDWDCNLRTWFRDKTVNIYESLEGAISWLFDNEEQGIILEEDCVASLAFFDYCQQLLPRYKDDYRIWIISGDNYFEKQRFCDYDYFFSQDMQIYGWASWRSRWKQINWEKGLDIDTIREEGIINATFRTRRKKTIFSQMLYSSQEFVDETKCWDFSFLTYGMMNNALAVVPARNLVENIGLEGVHLKQKKKLVYNAEVTYNEPHYRIEKEPVFIAPNLEYDNVILRAIQLKTYSLRYRTLNKIKAVLCGIFNRGANN